MVVPNYALCPGTAEQPVGIADIALQMVRALEWTWRNVAAHGGDPSRITVSGHSAGGHLAAMLLGCDWKARRTGPACADWCAMRCRFPALHDLRPLQHAPFIADALRLTDAEALRLQPRACGRRRSAASSTAVVGGDESEEFIRQNALIRDAWGPRVVPVCEVLPGLDHFSIVDALADPAHRLHALAMQLLDAWSRAAAAYISRCSPALSPPRIT